MATKEKPRKLSAGSDQDLSVHLLADIPLKRRLEILFAANIIPSRSQLALKYQLPEGLIHNVLSHRKYLLENWKYNADSDSLLSKLDLENTMAMTELLMEWKRRVQLSGLQITDAALTRKAVYLQRVLNTSRNSLSEKWWSQFELNWEHKQFYDYESDSLEMEDILNDLEWMFSGNTFRRLMVKFRLAKNNGRIKCEDSSNNTNESDSLEESFNNSDITAEPHYYNDDDFECEGYEFVLDEEVVLESLRKELEDLEQARYHQYFIGDVLSNESTGQEEENAIDSMTEESYVEDSAINDPIDDVKENMDSLLQKTSSTNMHDLPKEVIRKEKSSKDGQSFAAADILSITPEEPPTKPDRVKRKPRNLHGVLSLRKDYVRLPAAAEVAQLARKDCLDQLRKDSDDEDDENEKLDEQKKRSRRKKSETNKSKPLRRQLYKGKTKTKTISHSSQSAPEDSTSDVIEMQPLNHSEEQLEPESSFEPTRDSITYDSFDDAKTDLPIPVLSENEKFTAEDSAFTEKQKGPDIQPRDINLEQNNNDADKLAGVHFRASKVKAKRPRRSNIKTVRESWKGVNNKKKLETEVGKNVKQTSEIEVEEEIKATAIQSKGGPQTRHKNIRKQRKPRSGKQANKNNKKQVRILNTAIEQGNITRTTYKRAKRRTDGSDLTLRKDKVRLNLGCVAGEKHATNFPAFPLQNEAIETDVQMVFEPYTGDVQ